MITLTYCTNYVSEETGYSGWVHVSYPPGEDDYAEATGYWRTQEVALSGAHAHAERMGKLLRLAGHPYEIVRGKDT